MTRAKLFLPFLAFSFIFFINGTFAQLGVHPTIVNFKLTGGQTESHAVHLSNGSDKKIQFRLYLSDWLRDSVGGHRYSDPSTLPHSCSRWVNIDKNFVELEPGKAADVTIKLTLPDSNGVNDEMKWSMLFIETVEEQVNEQGKGTRAAVKNLLRVGVHIYQTPPMLTEKRIAVHSLTKLSDTLNIYRVLCENTGQVMVEGKSFIELNSLNTGEKIKLDAVEFPMFPSQRRYVAFDLPADLPKGKYSALAVLDAGEDVSLEAVESEIEVK